MTAFADHFSAHAAAYARARPAYPPSLFEWLAEVVGTPSQRVWDCGTGNGQAAVHLARHFDLVIATDPSVEQLMQGAADHRIRYVAALAEAAPVASGSIALVTIAQALHWFDRSRFYAEVRRVATPRAWIAAWSYGHFRVSPDVDPLFDEFHYRTLAPYWPPERQLVDDGYRTIEFPFERIAVPAFDMVHDWTRDELIGYLATWSGVATARRLTGNDPIPPLRNVVRRLWPGDERRPVRWPLVVLAGRV